jgi:hypothetical protein
MKQQEQGPLPHDPPSRFAVATPLRSLKMSANVANAIFSKSFLERACEGTHGEILSELAASADVTPLSGERFAAFFERIYATLVSDYRCEYVLKNEIANKLFLARHNPSRSSLLTEVRVGVNRVDLVIVNGSATAYEVKTEFDSLNRLDSQLAAYLRVFPRVCVAAAPIHIEHLVSEIDARVGIIEYTSRGTLSTVRRPLDNTSNVDPESVFEIMRMPEFLGAIANEFGAVPSVPNGLLHSECSQLFSKLVPTRAAAALISTLRQRAISRGDERILAGLPYSLTQLFFEVPLKMRARLFDSGVLQTIASA